MVYFKMMILALLFAAGAAQAHPGHPCEIMPYPECEIYPY